MTSRGPGVSFGHNLKRGILVPPPFGPCRNEGTAGSFGTSEDRGSSGVLQTRAPPGFFRTLPGGRWDDRAQPHEEGSTIKDPQVRVNDQIRISPVRLISDEGGQLGIVSIDEARAHAEEAGLDLVEVAPNARPPVVKLMDYGKYKYEQARAAREARKKQHQIQVKEVKFRPGIEEHDYEFKARHARRFLEEGNKVRLTMMFRGRQITHADLGREVLERLRKELTDVGEVESGPSFEGRNMHMVLAPRKTK